jgi:hypothetical protein
MKNVQNSVRWSPRRVGVIVMYSRSAQNDTSPNRTTVAGYPMSSPAIRMPNIMHQASTRLLNVRTTAGLVEVSGERRSARPTISATSRQTSTVPSRISVRVSSRTRAARSVAVCTTASAACSGADGAGASGAGALDA